MDSLFCGFDDFEIEPIHNSFHLDNKPSLIKQNSFTMDFEQPSTIPHEQNQDNEIIDIFQDQTTQTKLNKNSKTITKIDTKNNEKNKKKKTRQLDYRKNICRNILRHAIKSMINCSICSDYIEELVNDPKQFKIHYNKLLEQITGPRVLRGILLPNQNDNLFQKNMKFAFKQYLIWYLKTRATSMILQGDSISPKEYLNYKNDILLYYIQRPHEWTSNNPDWKVRCEDQTQLICWEDNISQQS